MIDGMLRRDFLNKKCPLDTHKSPSDEDVLWLETMGKFLYIGQYNGILSDITKIDPLVRSWKRSNWSILINFYRMKK
jgi:hypothetical protein